ncbi:hypothetical protein [Emticicia oligotrophica]|uniref:hypothetical protein n=1 Tax=Emticicia oligotrophica TaxID=312279 RepID=UPI00273CD85F|nr:hypothetical protein [Emticicia oligotrophica]
MTLKKEPLEVDFVVESRPLTKEEELAISEFIKADKAKRTSRVKPGQKKVVRKKHQNKVSK